MACLMIIALISGWCAVMLIGIVTLQELCFERRYRRNESERSEKSHAADGVLCMNRSQKARILEYITNSRRQPSWRSCIWHLTTRAAHWAGARSRFAEWSFNKWIASRARDSGLTRELENEILGTGRRR